MVTTESVSADFMLQSHSYNDYEWTTIVGQLGLTSFHFLTAKIKFCFTDINISEPVFIESLHFETLPLQIVAYLVLFLVCNISFLWLW